MPFFAMTTATGALASDRRPPASLLLLSVAVRLVGGARAHDSDRSPCPMDAIEPSAGNVSYPASAYRRAADGGRVLCACEVKPCVLKCCKPHMVFGENGCSPYPSELSVYEVPKFVNASGTIEVYDTDKFHVVHAKLKCPREKYKLTPSKDNPSDNFRISEAGWLVNEGGHILAPPGLFCLERFSKMGQFQVLPVVCSLTKKEYEQLEHVSHGDLNDDRSLNVYYTVAMILSLPFLFSTFLVYALIRDLRNLHGKSLMCHVATLLVAYTSLIVVQFTTNHIDQIMCISLAYTVQFFFLASFFWLNVMCFDLWWTFSGFRPLRGNLKENEAKKFLIYSIYAWGCPSIISMITFCIDASLAESIISTATRPGFGITRCWFDSKSATLLYFYGPIGVLLFCNLLMFIYTSIKIVIHMKARKVFKGSECNRNVDHDKQRFMLYLKLFIVMGVNWLAEIISWAMETEKNGYLFYVTDFGNSLQGVFIFCIFVCKKRVIRLLNQSLCPQIEIWKTSNNLSSKTTLSTFSRASTKNKETGDVTKSNVNNHSTGDHLHDFKV